MLDSVMDVQRAINGDRPAAEDGRRTAPGVRTRAAHGVDPDATPRVLAMIVLGSVIVLALLRVGGFRFSFGANIGGAS